MSGPLFSLFFWFVQRTKQQKCWKWCRCCCSNTLLLAHTLENFHWLAAAAAAADGFVFRLPKFCLKLENIKQTTSRNKTDYEASKQQQAVATRSSKEQDGDGFIGSKKMMVM